MCEGYVLIVRVLWSVNISSWCFMVAEFKQEEFLGKDHYNLLASNLSSTYARFNGSVNLESQE